MSTMEQPSSLTASWMMTTSEGKFACDAMARLRADLTQLSGLYSIVGFDINDAERVRYQTFVNFEDGTGMSIIYGKGTYGYDKQQFEIAIFHGGEFVTTHYGANDDCIGYLEPNDIFQYIKQIHRSISDG